MKEAIHQTLNEVLMGQLYENDKVVDWCKQISDGVKDRIKEMGYDRYKVSQRGHERDVKVQLRDGKSVDHNL